MLRKHGIHLSIRRVSRLPHLEGARLSYATAMEPPEYPAESSSLGHVGHPVGAVGSSIVVHRSWQATIPKVSDTAHTQDHAHDISPYAEMGLFAIRRYTVQN